MRRAYLEDQKYLSQYDPAVTSDELQRREAENAELNRLDTINEALAYCGILEPLLDELGLYWRGDLRELIQTLREMVG